MARDQYYSSSRRGRASDMPDRDDHGRFMSESQSRHHRGERYDYDDGSYRQSPSRYDRDDRDYSVRGHGGWYGDPEGHAMAAREGWRQRGDGRGYSRDRNDGRGRGYTPDYDRDYRSAGDYGRDDGMDRGSDMDRGYGARPSRDSRYGRYEGRNEDRGYSSHDYSPRGSSIRGDASHGGWYGDPEGHAEAARRGWDHRR